MGNRERLISGFVESFLSNLCGNPFHSIKDTISVGLGYTNSMHGLGILEEDIFR